MTICDSSLRLVLSVTLASTLGVTGCCLPVPSCGAKRSFAIPNTYPIGSSVRAHYHTMETNGEAGEFVVHRNEFVNNTAELNCDGKDHVMELAARMRSTPFPVLVERSENNSDPELDQLRRDTIAQILCDFGNPDAVSRVVVSTAYNKAQNSQEGEMDYYRFIFSRGGFSGGGGGGSAGGGGFSGGGGFGGGGFF